MKDITSTNLANSHQKTLTSAITQPKSIVHRHDIMKTIFRHAFNRTPEKSLWENTGTFTSLTTPDTHLRYSG